MRGRQREAYSMYKRLSSRDYTNTVDMEAKELIDAIDVEENSGNSIYWSSEVYLCYVLSIVMHQ